MTVYKCDMCGEIHDYISEMDNVVISYAGKANVSYPRDGRFHICRDCHNKLFELFHAYDDREGESDDKP